VHAIIVDNDKRLSLGTENGILILDREHKIFTTHFDDSCTLEVGTFKRAVME